MHLSEKGCLILIANGQITANMLCLTGIGLIKTAELGLACPTGLSLTNRARHRALPDKAETMTWEPTDNILSLCPKVHLSFVLTLNSSSCVANY